MKGATTIILLITASVLLCLVSAQPAMSEELLVSGEVIETLREESVVIIDFPDGSDKPFILNGFPYNFAERELEWALSQPKDSIAIETGDCITVSYIRDEMGRYSEEVNKAVALTYYCDDCIDSETCYDDSTGIVFLEPEGDEYAPVNKNPNMNDANGAARTAQYRNQD